MLYKTALFNSFLALFFLLVACSADATTGNASSTADLDATLEAAGVGGQTCGERSAEITSGRAIFQQGLTTTCKDSPTKASTVGGERILVWRMSPYER